MMLLSCQDDIGETTKRVKYRVNIDGAKLLFIASQNSTSTLYGVKSASYFALHRGGEDQVLKWSITTKRENDKGKILFM